MAHGESLPVVKVKEPGGPADPVGQIFRIGVDLVLAQSLFQLSGGGHLFSKGEDAQRIGQACLGLLPGPLRHFVIPDVVQHRHEFC